MSRFVLSIGLLSALSLIASGADEAKPVKITVVIRGMATEEDAGAVRKVLQKFEGIKIRTEDIRPGEKGRFGHYFSLPSRWKLGILTKPIWEQSPKWCLT